MATDGAHASRFFLTYFAAQALQVPIQHIVNERALAAAAHTGDAAEDSEWQVHIKLLEVVLPRALELEPLFHGTAFGRHRDALATKQVVARE